MNGAMAEPSVKITNSAIKSRNIKIGASHHFLRSRRKSQNSFKIYKLDINTTPSRFKIILWSLENFLNLAPFNHRPLDDCFTNG